MDQTMIRRRLQALRERRDLSQAALSEALGFNDRQTLSYIELGKRRVAPEDLVRAAEFFEVDPGYFTDPLELAGEANFSWRKAVAPDGLESFEERAGGWIATYRHLCRLKGESVNSLLARVSLHAKSSFEEAASEGEAVSRSLDLGDVPSASLASVLEGKLDTLVLHVDTVAGVSGAACQLGPLNTIIINRRESAGRRAFDIGHELFHLLTWRDMAPAHIEEEGKLSRGQNRIEHLADNFAAGLLMPRRAVEGVLGEVPPLGDGMAQVRWIREAAAHLRVSGPAMKWRLVALGVLKKAAAQRIDDGLLRTDADDDDLALPPRFSRRFVTTLGWGVEQGHLSVRRAASVVGTDVDDLAALFTEHGLKTPFDL
jgi:Zn-dependent peptidase ImmA (M78 family)/transcriptional regulator with XRE-family HTH domain